MLDTLQIQLEAHFAALADLRRPAGYPVYAIEHGQTEDIIRAAREAASLEHRTYGLRRQHWLVWVTLAAEAGYGYDGDEYWPSLELTAGAWRAQTDRQVLRAWFERFQREFAGPTPEGRWAQHFSIIAWPIAGALLPKYLQGHFARHLFHIRYGLSRLADAGADEIGAYLAATGDQRSARYDDFLEQTDLTGRIVLALRDEDLNELVPRIIPNTLSRIVADLEGRREAGEFLRAARQVLRSARGVAASTLAGDGKPRSGLAKSDDMVRPPRLVARVADGATQLGLHMPDFAAAFKKAALAPAALGRMRVRQHGETERWAPGAVLLSWSNREVPLVSFPEAGDSAIELEGASGAVLPLLAPLITLEDRPLWLLRRHEDNAYRQVAGNQVRPSQGYVVVARGAVPAELARSLAMRSTTTGLTGAFAYAFKTPPSISQAYRTALKQLGLGYSLRARVEPLGLNPVVRRDFDGPSWAAGEEVMLRLTADFPAAEFILDLDAGGRSRLAAADAAILVSLGALPVGRHTLRISAVARNATADGAIDVSPVAFDFEVFEPRPWTDVASERAGFRVLLDPANASLENVLTGHAAVSLYGPSGRRVNWRLETIDASGQVAGGGPLTQISLPMGENGFAPALRRLKEYSDAIDAAHRVDLVAELDELGRQTVRFPHRVEPLRWSLDPVRQHLRLIDETAHDEDVRVTRIDVASPARFRTANASDLVAGIDMPGPGALYSATYKGERYIAFASVPVTERLSAFSELGLRQDCSPGSDEPAPAVVTLVAALQHWRRARPIGRLAAVRKTQTLAGLYAELRRTACGANWTALLGTVATPTLERAQGGVGGSPGFGWRMRTTDWVNLPWPRVRAELFRHAQHYSITSDRDLANQAATLAFRPWRYRPPAGLNPAEAIGRLLAVRPLVRGAFLAQATAPAIKGAVAA
ncbi:hypothetical protein [Caulobacter sp. UNC358MFTsu5.1]|uniref:hypothetical protein n=1 Tax=Caulobacter sp. UNC358MFTsu5.1 TaxID=1449049 RepID=UPI0004A6F2AC|nr:hypothetical protein [Caulobacter sp. UNC358MFTsu5.1]